MAPKYVSANRPYSTYVRTSHLEDHILLAMMFREQRVTDTLTENSYNNLPMTFDQGGRKFAAEKSFDCKILMKYNNQCHDKVLNIRRIEKKSYIFVQLDKPIYKPGDEIKFRIISLNNTLQPFKPNNVNVTLLDPKGAFAQDRTNLTNVNNLGLFSETFFLPENVDEGKWSILIQIGRVNTTKSFRVKKYTRPFYEFKMDTQPKITLDDENLVIDVKPVSSFGGFIAGNVKIEVSTSANNSTRNKYIENLESFKFSLKKDLDLSYLPSDFIIVKVTATFKDHLNLFTEIRKSSVKVYHEKACSLEVTNIPRGTEGYPYGFSVTGEYFDGTIITKSSLPVKAEFRSKTKGCQDNKIKSEYFDKSIASFKFMNTKMCSNENIIEISFSNCKKSFNVQNDERIVEKLFLRRLSLT